MQVCGASNMFESFRAVSSWQTKALLNQNKLIDGASIDSANRSACYKLWRHWCGESAQTSSPQCERFNFVHASRAERFEIVRYQLAARRTMTTDSRANGFVTKFECTNSRYAHDLDP